MKRLLWFPSFLIAALCSAATPGISGTYIDENNPSNAMVLVENADGSVEGSFEGEVDALPIKAQRQGDRLKGTVGEGADAQRFVATIAGDRLVFEVAEAGAQSMKQTFVRMGAAEPAAVAGSAAPAAAKGNSTKTAQPAATPERAKRNVTINDQRLSDEELAQIEQTYRVQIVDADYWYDKVSGAWGIKGGPTRGFVYSGLNLGGTLKADASGGGTRVFINRRELHPMDVAGLQRCMPVIPGHYWVMADGTGGYEGGPPLFNVVSLCSPKNSSGRSGGWLCDGGNCGTDRTVTGAYGVVSEGGGQAGVYTDQGLILTPN